MNELTPSPAPHQDFLEERVLMLMQELDLSIYWQRHGIWMVAYSSEYVRADTVSMLENCLHDRGQKSFWLHANDLDINSLNVWVENFRHAADMVFFIDGLGNKFSQPANLHAILNHIGDAISHNNVRIVIWLTCKEISALARLAPDFWALRNRLFEFASSPKPEQILQSAVESAWYGTGEYDVEFEDTDAKISLRESFLIELPKNAESASIRANLLLTLGVLNWRKGDYEKANELLEDALNIATKIQDTWFEAECFNALALVCTSLGKNSEAINAYKQAIKLAPNQIFAWNNLGNLCLKITRNDEAMIAFQKAIDHNPLDPIAWNGMGDVYSCNQYVDDAIAAYRKSIDCSPLLPYPWNGLGEVYAGMGRVNEAVTAFEKAIELNQHFITPWLRLADLFAKQERYREAVKAYRQALVLDPRNCAVWNDLGTVYLNAEKIEDAIDSFSKAIELDRGSGWAYSNLGLAYTIQGKPKESIQLYLRSIELLTDEEQKTITWNRLATSYRSLNEYDKAIKAYQMADSLLSEPFADLYPASNDPESNSVSDAVSTLATESRTLEEGCGTRPSGVEAPQTKPMPVEEAPYWVFHSSEDAEKTMPSTRGEVPISVGTRLGFSPAEEAMSVSAVDISENETVRQKTGGLTMQTAMPLYPNHPAQNDPSLIASDEPINRITPAANPGRARVWNEMGNVHFHASEFEKAIGAYKKALELDRSFGWPYCNLGITYLALGRYSEAVSLLQISIELLKNNGDRAVAWNGLGNLYRSVNDYDNAVVAYQKADELDPSHAGISDEVGHFNTESNTEDAQAWIELGDQFFQSNSYHDASKCYKKATEMEPLNGAAYGNLALCLSYQSKFRQAVPFYLKSIELLRDDKEKAISWNRLGNVYRRLNDYDNASAAYQAAVKLNYEPMSLVSRARFSLLGNCFVD